MRRTRDNTMSDCEKNDRELLLGDDSPDEEEEEEEIEEMAGVAAVAGYAAPQRNIELEGRIISEEELVNEVLKLLLKK